MPELPEVETVVRSLRRHGLIGRRVTAVRVAWARTVATPSASVLAERLRGRRIRDVARRGKWIRIDLDRDTLLVHLRMTGRFEVCDSNRPPDPHDRICLALDDGRELRFHDPRKFGRWWLTDDPDRQLSGIGPEPLDPRLTSAGLHAVLQERTRCLKPLLLDQSFLAGIGNIYADESLWAAGLHPLRRSDTLTPGEVADLLRALRAVLRRAIRNAGTSLGHGETNFRDGASRRGRNREALQIYQRTGQPCRRCGAPVRRLVVGQRSTHICERCQPPPSCGASDRR